MNKVILMGRLTKDVEVKYSQSQKAVVRFTLAVDRRAKGEADFVSCVAFDKTAEFMGKYLAKGRQIALSGRILTGSYDKDGKKVYTTEVIADEIFFADSKHEEQTNNNADGAIPSDLPF